MTVKSPSAGGRAVEDLPITKICCLGKEMAEALKRDRSPYSSIAGVDIFGDYEL